METQAAMETVVPGACCDAEGNCNAAADACNQQAACCDDGVCTAGAQPVDPATQPGLEQKSLGGEMLAMKESGNRFFSLENYEGAAECYKHGLALAHANADAIMVAPAEVQQSVLNVTMNLFLNVAACSLKLGQLAAAIEQCNQALGIDGNSVKGLYRRGCAYLEMGDLRAAQDDLAKARRLDSTDATIKYAHEMVQDAIMDQMVAQRQAAQDGQAEKKP